MRELSMSYIKSNLYTIMFIIFAFPVMLYSQGLTDLTYGYSPIGYDAKTMAMQNIGVASNASVASILVNPAAAKSEKTLQSLKVDDILQQFAKERQQQKK